jgi:hypothetical protein
MPWKDCDLSRAKDKEKGFSVGALGGSPSGLRIKHTSFIELRKSGCLCLLCAFQLQICRYLLE